MNYIDVSSAYNAKWTPLFICTLVAIALTTSCSLLCCIFSIWALFKRRKQVPMFGMLFMHTLSSLLLSATFLAEFVDIMADHFAKGSGNKFRVPTAQRIRQIILINLAEYSQIFVFLTGALLALDRVVIMAMPFRYQRWRISYRFALFSAVCGLEAFLIMFSIDVITPIVKSQIDLVSSDALGYVSFVGTCVFISENLLLVLFCLQYRRYSKSQQKQLKHSDLGIQMNHITLFQTLCLAVLVTVPQALDWMDNTFFVRLAMSSTGSFELQYMFGNLRQFEPILSAFYILLTSAFTASKLRRKKMTVRVQSIQTTHSNMGGHR